MLFNWINHFAEFGLLYRTERSTRTPILNKHHNLQTLDSFSVTINMYQLRVLSISTWMNRSISHCSAINLCLGHTNTKYCSLDPQHALSLLLAHFSFFHTKWPYHESSVYPFPFFNTKWTMHSGIDVESTTTSSIKVTRPHKNDSILKRRIDFGLQLLQSLLYELWRFK